MTVNTQISSVVEIPRSKTINTVTRFYTRPNSVSNNFLCPIFFKFDTMKRIAAFFILTIASLCPLVPALSIAVTDCSPLQLQVVNPMLADTEILAKSVLSDFQATPPAEEKNLVERKAYNPL